MPTINVYISDMVYTDSNSPNSTFIPGSVLDFNPIQFGWLFGKFDVPEFLKIKDIGVSYLNVFAESSDRGFDAFALKQSYRNDATYNNYPWIDTDAGSMHLETVKGTAKYWRTQAYYDQSLEMLKYGVCFQDETVLKIHTHKSSNKPYLELTYSDIQMEAGTIYPASRSYANKHKKISIQLQCRKNWVSIQDPTIKSASILVQDGASEPFTVYPTEIINSSDIKVLNFEILAETIKAGPLKITQITITSSDNVRSVKSSTYELNTNDALSTAVPIDPVDKTIDIESENLFTWQHVIATGTDPTGYSIEYSTNGVSWVLLASRTTLESSCVVPPNTFPGGKMWWRVRTNNADGVPGAWSEPAAIIGYGAPPPPSILGVENKARPKIKWQSIAQVAYELEILQNKTLLVSVKETATTEKRYQVLKFLQDGTYTLRMRIKNGGGHYSAWATMNFSVLTVKPEMPVISGRSIANGVLIETVLLGTFYLMRDGIPIAKMQKKYYEDFAALGEHVYSIRHVDVSGSFQDSENLVLKSSVNQAIIAAAKRPENMIGPILQAKENQYQSAIGIAYSAKHYAGRKYPVIEAGTAINEEFSLQFASYTQDQFYALQELMEQGRPVLYRSSAGDRAYCIITKLAPVKFGVGFIEWSMTMERIDYIDGIAYDEVN